MEKVRIREARMTRVQLQMLVDIIAENPELISGKLTREFTKTHRRQKWQTLAILLNSKGLGPAKDADKWRKSWADLKCTVRSKAAKIELAGGADLLCEKLTNLEKRVLHMIGDVTTKLPERVESEDISGLTINERISLMCKNKTGSPKIDFSSFQKELGLSEAGTHTKIVNSTSDTGNMTVSKIEVSKKADDGEDDDDSEEVIYDDDVNIDEDNEYNDGDSQDVNNYEQSDNPDMNNYEDSHNFENSQDNSNEHGFSPMKKRKISFESTSDSKPVVKALRRSIDLQTMAMKEQTHVLRDIAKSLQIIAKNLQK